MLGEAIVRWVLNMKPYHTQSPPPPYDTAMRDEVLGWKMTPNYRYKGELWANNQSNWLVELEFDENGFKSFGDPATTQSKVFFIGDSYTASVEISNDKSYFNLLADSLGFSVFAYGQPGFSTLQQLMILEQYLSLIQPDLIVLQYCSNDFKDNYADLERISNYNVKERRPYRMADGSISYIRPVSWGYVLGEYSAFFRFLRDKWISLSRCEKEGDTYVDVTRGEYRIAHEHRRFKLYDEAVQCTHDLLKAFKEESGTDIPMISFMADNTRPEREDFEAILQELDIPYTYDHLQLLYTAKQAGEIVHTGDGYHWNERGHELVAKGLVEIIRKYLR